VDQSSKPPAGAVEGGGFVKQAAADVNSPTAQIEQDGAALSGARDALVDDLLAGRFFSIDVRGQVTGWNPRAEAAFGWPTHHVSGQSLFDRLLQPAVGFGPEDLQDFFAAAAGGFGRRVRVLVHHMTAGDIAAELSIVPIQLAKAYELNAFLQDVSTSTASGVASEMGRVREEYASVINMISGSLEQDPAAPAAGESRLAGALVVFHNDASGPSEAPPPTAAPAERPAAAAATPSDVSGVARAEAELVRAQIDEAHGAADLARAEADAARRERDELRARLDAAAADAPDAMAAQEDRERVASLEAELAAARAAAVSARDDAAALQKEADGAHSQVEAAHAELAAARAELQAVLDELEVLRAQAQPTVFERIFDNAAIGMAIKRDGRFTRVNRAFCQLTGHAAERLLAIDPIDLVHPDERDAHTGTERSLAAGDADSSQAEVRLVHADGSQVPVRESASLLEDGTLLVQFEAASLDAHTGVEDRGPAAEPDAGAEEPEPSQSTALEPSDGVVERIRRALAEDTFELFAQPIIDLKSNEITQYELLIRMRDDAGRLVLPDKFLPAATHAGLMPAVDQWVVRQAFRLIREAALDGRELLLEVNISPDSIDDPALPALIEVELDATGVDPRSLVIEVTEDAALAKIDDTIKLSQWVRSMGCRFALDDFGSTFATVKYLKDMPVDYFKLDGDLIVSLPESRTNQLLVNALMDVARGTGTETIAVYVPNDETLALLRDLGIGYGQGNRVGRPRPVSEI
jgi:PAS domain S-box-containing protein